MITSNPMEVLDKELLMMKKITTSIRSTTVERGMLSI